MKFSYGCYCRFKKNKREHFYMKNCDEMIEFMLSEYERQQDKKDFLEFWVWIKLSDNAWGNRFFRENHS